jgi:hypothetical protein
MKVHVHGFAEPVEEAIPFLLYPYDVRFVKEEEADAVICRDTSPVFPNPQIRVPSVDPRERAGSGPKVHGNGIVDLQYDLITHCSTLLQKIMSPKVAAIHRLATRLPIQYNFVPSSLRSRLLRTRNIDSDLSKHLAIESCRKTLFEAFELLGLHLQKRGQSSLIVTHDIETSRGLKRAISLKEIEDELGVTSTWFLPSCEYEIPRTLAGELSEGSTIGSHDVRHDGKLIHIRSHQKLVERLLMSRLRLEEVFEKEVDRFRAPLLQFSRRILGALAEAGYKSDFSLPCWEPVYPMTMSGFGMESVQPFEMSQIVEYPLTLFQDHQVLNVLGLNTKECVKFLVEQAKLVRSFDGQIVLLVHPDYSFSENLGDYRTLLSSMLGLVSN